MSLYWRLQRLKSAVAPRARWLVEDLESQKANALLEAAPLTTTHRWLSLVIELVFLPLEVGMAIGAFLALPASIVAWVAILFGPRVDLLVLAVAAAPIAWFLLRRPRAELKSLFFKRIAAHAWAVQARRQLSAIGSTSSPLAVPVRLHEDDRAR